MGLGGIGTCIGDDTAAADDDVVVDDDDDDVDDAIKFAACARTKSTRPSLAL